MSPTTYRDVFRTNLAREREQRGMTQDGLASELRAHGLSWTQATVAAVEAGRRAVTAEEEKVLMCVLKVHLGDLLKSKVNVFISTSSSVSSEGLRKLAQGLPAKLKVENAPSRRHAKADITWPGGVAEMKAASKLGVSRDVVLDTCVLLWGRTLTEERDARSKALGATTSAQKGRVTRRLLTELESAFAGEETSKARPER